MPWYLKKNKNSILLFIQFDWSLSLLKDLSFRSTCKWPKNKCIDEYVMRKKKDIIIDKIFSYSFLRFWSFLWMHVFVYLICLFGYLNQNLILYFTPCNSQSQSVWPQLWKCCMASSFNVTCILMFEMISSSPCIAGLWLTVNNDNSRCIFYNQIYYIVAVSPDKFPQLLPIYTTKGRDRFHWAVTPLKPHEVGNICYMKYRYSVLYFLNLSLKHFFPTENGNFCENIQIRRPLSFRVLTCRACPIDVLPNRR